MKSGIPTNRFTMHASPNLLFRVNPVIQRPASRSGKCRIGNPELGTHWTLVDPGFYAANKCCCLYKIVTGD